MTFLCSIKKTILPCLLALPWAVTAQITTTFESADDLAAFTTLVTDATVSATQQAGQGAGSPATGGLRIESTTSQDRSVVLHRTASATAGAVTVFQQSMLFNARNVDDMGAVESKIETRMGFSVPLTVTGNYKELLHKVTANKNMHVKLKAEHKPADSSKLRNLEVEMTNYVTSETKYGKVTLNNSASFDDWLRLTFTLTRTSGTVFSLGYTLESLGADGTSEPVQLASFTQANVTGADFGNAGSITSVLIVNSDKAAGTAWVDDHTFSARALPPGNPAALEAASITYNALTARWTPGSGASGHVVEISTLADHFSENSLISQTGQTGRAEGFSISGGSTASAVITGLLSNTSYVYRIRAVNAAGTSAASNEIEAFTLMENVNVPPTLDVIPAHPPLTPAAPQQTISLSGITAGFGETQTLTVKARSSSTSVIPHPVVAYTSPQTTGAISFTPTGDEGAATITVTVNDGQPDNNIIERSFDIVVRQPPLELAFENPSDMNEYVITSLRGSLTHSPDGGLGSPPSGGAVFQGLGNGSDHGSVALRSQAYPGPAPTLMRQSIWVNFREINAPPSVKNKGEVRFGFASHNVVPSEPKKFFEEGSGRYAIHCKVTGENDPTDPSKDHVIKARLTNWNGTTKTDGLELVVSDPSIFDHWLKCTFEAVAVGTVQFQLVFKVEDYGPDGGTLLGTVIQGTPVNFVNAGLITAPWIYAGFYTDTEKTSTSRVFLDNHRVEVQNLPPETPQALDAVQVTSTSFTSAWNVLSGAYPNGFVIEVIPSGAAFTPGNFINASGITGRQEGVTVNFADQRTLRFFNLTGSTPYQYRVRALNVAGASGSSQVVAVTTLPPGSNARPTLDVIADLEDTAANAAPVTVPLRGISDGGEFTQNVTITATSSNPDLIPSPVEVTYANPEETGLLTLRPAFLKSGTATITVTVDDGQETANLLQRQFTINLVNPQALLTFDSVADASAYQVQTTQSTLAQVLDEGAGAPASGAFKFERSTLAAEHVAFATRRVRYDARVIPHARTSLMLNLSSAVGILSGKDKAEGFLGFITDTIPAANMKDTFNKAVPSLSLKFKLEHEAGRADKDRRFELEMVSYDGTSEIKGGKQSFNAFASASNWLRLDFSILRAGSGGYLCSYEVHDCGPDGSTSPTRLHASGSASLGNTTLANDSSLYAGFILSGEKSASTPFWLDNHLVEVNTSAPDAPANLAATDLYNEGFTLPWAGGLIGRVPTAYVIELCRQADDFAPGSLIAADGTPDQEEGILVEDPLASDILVSGLQPGQRYLYRVRALRDSEPSVTQPARTAQTTAVFRLIDQWRNAVFAGLLGDPRSALDADFDGDGIINAVEYSTGRDPLTPELLPEAVFHLQDGYLHLTFRRPALMEDVVITPQASSSMTAAGWSSSEVVHVSTSEPDAFGIQTVTVRDSIPLSGAVRRFLRLHFDF